MNSEYNAVRTLAQYFMEGRDLNLNRTLFKRAPNRIENGFSVQKAGDWLGPLSPVFRSGNLKGILHHHLNRDPLLKELAKDPIGYLVAPPSIIEAIFDDQDLSFLVENGTQMVIPIDEEADQG